MWTDATANVMSVDDVSVVSAPAPRIESMTPGKPTAAITWSAVPGQSYRVQYEERLSDSNWQNVLPDVTAVGAIATANVSAEGVAQRFYRVMLVSGVPAPAPRIESITLSKPIATITWSAIPGQSYRVQYKDNVRDTNWHDLLPEITATDTTAAANLSAGSAAQRFYRLMLVP
jgi:hypothetical protein